MNNMTMKKAIEYLNEDCVVIRVSDGLALCSDVPGFCSTGHVVSVRPYHVEWNEDNIAIDKVASMFDNGSSWCLAPRPFDCYEIGSAGPFDFEIIE